MSKLLSIDNKLFVWLSRAVDLVALNIIFLITCIPIVTIGAAFTALYSVTLKMARDEESYIFKSYFSSFKANFKESTKIWLVMAMVYILLEWDVRILSETSNQFFTILLGILAVVQLLWCIIFAFVFPVAAQFKNSVRVQLKNALFIPLSRVIYGVGVMLITYVPLIVILHVPSVFLYGCYLFVMGGIAAIALANAYLLNKLFEPYIKEATKGSQADSEHELINFNV